MTALAGLAGVLVTGGVWLAVTSWRPVPVTYRPGVRERLERVDPVRAAAAVVCGLMGLVLTRWPVAAAAAAVGGWVAAGWWRRRQTAADGGEGRSEAVAMWAEMLRDGLGTSRGIEGVLTATAPAAPVAIRREVQAMADRLRHEPLETTLVGLAEELNDPVTDLVVTSLCLSAVTGGSQLREVLSDLAAAAHAQAEAQRRVSVARERPRAAMRYTAVVIGGFVGVLMIFSRSYLDPYSTVGGQAVLAFVAGYWAFGLWWMARMARTPEPKRVLAPASIGERR